MPKLICVPNEDAVVSDEAGLTPIFDGCLRTDAFARKPPRHDYWTTGEEFSSRLQVVLAAILPPIIDTSIDKGFQKHSQVIGQSFGGQSFALARHCASADGINRRDWKGQNGQTAPRSPRSPCSSCSPITSPRCEQPVAGLKETCRPASFDRNVSWDFGDTAIHTDPDADERQQAIETGGSGSSANLNRGVFYSLETVDERFKSPSYSSLSEANCGDGRHRKSNASCSSHRRLNRGSSRLEGSGGDDEERVSGRIASVTAALKVRKTLTKSDSTLFSSRLSLRRMRSVGGNLMNNQSMFPDSKEFFVRPSTGCIRERLAEFIRSWVFTFLLTFSIMFNAVLVGVETEFPNAGHLVGDFQFGLNIWFVFEVLFRLAVLGCREFFHIKDRYWNSLDLALGALCALDLWYTEPNASTQLFRLLRIVRLLRSLRLIKYLQHMREFRKMVFSMAVSLQTLFWACVLLLFVIYVFGVWFTSYVQSTNENLPPETVLGLDRYFGSLSKSMLSLWMSITGGFNWFYIVDPLYQTDTWLAALFLAYIAITVLGVMNIVTSVFVESAMRSTQHYRDLLLQEKSRAKEVFAKHLREIFCSIDVDKSGMITLKELKQFLADETLDLQEYLDALELNAEDAKALFKLLDTDCSGEIDIDEFCDGCLKLKGEAKSFDINCLIFESKRVDTKLTHVMQGIDVVMSLHIDLMRIVERMHLELSPDTCMFDRSVDGKTAGTVFGLQRTRSMASMDSTSSDIVRHLRHSLLSSASSAEPAKKPQQD